MTHFEFMVPASASKSNFNRDQAIINSLHHSEREQESKLDRVYDNLAWAYLETREQCGSEYAK